MTTETIRQILNSPCTSYWLREAIKTSLERDSLDALRDAEILFEICNDRYLKAIARG